jgi:N-acetylmuramoyl-L-alanine amidase/FlgD Ig-like domain
MTVFRRSLLSVAAVLLAAPAVAEGETTIVERPIRLDGSRPLVAGGSQPRFTLVGLHWRGPGRVEVRTRSAAGRWSPWRPAAPEAEDLPDPGSAERSRATGWRLGNPWWVGPSDRLEVRARGPVRRVRAFTIWSPELRVPLRRPAAAGAPAIVPRAGWGADESIRRAPPSYASAIRYAVVHHTAGANAYSQVEAAAIVRAIQLYHVKGNGWNDIGYNFLVDRFGTVYEGRYGGVDRNVVGAHAQGFNTGSTGVAVLGTYTGSAPTAAAEEALARLLAWRLDLAHVDPLTTMGVVSGGNPRFPEGIPVFLRAISGHRDTGLTECPGNAFYARLGALAARVSEIGLPKLYEPSVAGSVGGLVRFRARLSAFAPWTVTVTDTAGRTTATGAGTGTNVDWTWNSVGAAAGSYRWRIAGSGLTAASGSLRGSGGQTALAITGLAADPETISPNEDGQADSTTVTYTLASAATVSVVVLDAAGTPVVEVAPPSPQPAGEHAIAVVGSALADGTYTVRVSAAGLDGAQVTAQTPLLVTRTLGAVALAPAAFSPNRDGRADRLTVRFRLAAAAQVRIRVLREGRWVATPFAGPLPAGGQLVSWDGSKRLGRLLDGAYTAVVEATDQVGTAALEAAFASDTRRPTVRVLPGRPLRVWVSEPATVTLRVDGRPLQVVSRRPGAVRVPGVQAAANVRAVAWDLAGNVSAPVRRP